MYHTSAANSYRYDVNIFRKDTCIPYCTLNTAFNHSFWGFDFARSESFLSQHKWQFQQCTHIHQKSVYVLSLTSSAVTTAFLQCWNCPSDFCWRRLNLVLDRAVKLSVKYLSHQLLVHTKIIWWVVVVEWPEITHTVVYHQKAMVLEKK